MRYGEWSADPNSTTKQYPFRDKLQHWRRLSFSFPQNILNAKLQDTYENNHESVWNAARTITLAQLRLQWDSTTDRPLLNSATARKHWPIFTASDGGHKQIAKLPKSLKYHRYITTASVAMFKAPPSTLISGDPAECLQHIPEPLIIRINRLPRNI